MSKRLFALIFMCSVVFSAYSTEDTELKNDSENIERINKQLEKKIREMLLFFLYGLLECLDIRPCVITSIPCTSKDQEATSSFLFGRIIKTLFM